MRTTYGTLKRVGKEWVLSDIPPHVSIRIKSTFPKISKTTTKKFTFRITEENCADLDWFLNRYPMAMSDEDRALLASGRKTFERKRDEIETILAPDWKPPERYGFKPGYAPYQTQSQAIEIAHRLKRLLVLDDVGLGKSVIALGALAGSQYLPAAIVAPTHLPTQWVEEYVKKFTYMSSHIIRGTRPYSLPAANLFFFKYSNIAGWADVAATGIFKSVVFDEIQELRHGLDTEKGRAAKVFTDNAQLMLGLTATPVYGYASEAFNLVEYISPGALGTWDEFVREWCSTCTSSGKWIVDDPDALGTYLRELQLVVRRLRQGRPVNTLVVQVKHDEDIEHDSLALARTLALKVTTGSFTERGQAARELDMLARRITGLSKAKSVAAYARMLLKTNTPIIIALWHREVYEIMKKELCEFNPVMYTGTETPKQKDRSKAAFINGDTDCMFISLRSGLGVDGLQKRCSTVMFGELDWSAAAMDQCVGRVDRPGQPLHEVTAIYCWTNSGSDPVLMDLIGIKANQARGVLDPLIGVQKSYSDVSRIQKIAERYLMGVAA